MNPTTPTSPFSLVGKRAVITGGSRGIGAAIAQQFAEAGATVAIWGRGTADAVTMGESLGGIGVQCDVAETASVEAATAETIERIGGIDILVANAGMAGEGIPFLDIDDDLWERIVNTNLTGVFRCVRAAGKHMSIDKAGKIIIIGSIGAVSGMSRAPAYSAAKSGLLGLTRSAAAGLARYNIQVNCVLPGWIQTEMSSPQLDNEPLRKRLEDRTLMRRVAVPSEIAGICGYLASSASSFHTGDVIRVDGGYLNS